jgi:hypothetical protein
MKAIICNVTYLNTVASMEMACCVVVHGVDWRAVQPIVRIHWRLSGRVDERLKGESLSTPKHEICRHSARVNN